MDSLTIVSVVNRILPIKGKIFPIPVGMEDKVIPVVLFLVPTMVSAVVTDRLCCARRMLLGSGINPNYGGSLPSQNGGPSGGISAISYNPGSSSNNYYPNSNQQQYYPNNNNFNNAAQRPVMNTNYNQANNRYPPGSQGWYATGGNYWYNHSTSHLARGWLLITAIVTLVICM